MSADLLPWSHPTAALPLDEPTPAGWAACALGGLDALLDDHAHCELKAASAAMSLIGRFPEAPGLVAAMVALAHEEMRHFRQVLKKLESRGGALTPPRPDRYVRALRAWSFREKGGAGPLVDALLVCAFVEARSCERFRLLTEALREAGDQPELAAFYLQLADAEGRHWETFRDLARAAAPADQVARRLTAFSQAEGAIVAELPIEPRMH